MELFQKSGIKFCIACKSSRIACRWANTDTCNRIDPVVKGYFQNFGNIQVTRKQIGLLAKGTHFDTAAASPFTRVLERFPLAQQFEDIDIRVENRWIAMSLADHTCGSIQKFVGRFGADVNRTSGLQNMQLLNHFEHDIRYFACAVASIALYTPDVDVRKIVVGLSLIHISEPTRRTPISYAVFCLK